MLIIVIDWKRAGLKPFFFSFSSFSIERIKWVINGEETINAAASGVYGQQNFTVCGLRLWPGPSKLIAL